MSCHVYVLKSNRHDKSYVGSTNDLERRLSEHNNGKSAYTSKYKPWSIIYTEEFSVLKEARERERYLKGRSGRRFLKKIFDHKK